jgi:hypothetical protein
MLLNQELIQPASYCRMTDPFTYETNRFWWCCLNYTGKLKSMLSKLINVAHVNLTSASWPSYLIDACMHSNNIAVCIMHGLYYLITNHTKYTEVCLTYPFIVSTLVIDSDSDGASLVQQRHSRYARTNIGRTTQAPLCRLADFHRRDNLEIRRVTEFGNCPFLPPVTPNYTNRNQVTLLYPFLPLFTTRST